MCALASDSEQRNRCMATGADGKIAMKGIMCCGYLHVHIDKMIYWVQHDHINMDNMHRTLLPGRILPLRCHFNYCKYQHLHMSTAQQMKRSSPAGAYSYIFELGANRCGDGHWATKLYFHFEIIDATILVYRKIQLNLCTHDAVNGIVFIDWNWRRNG